MSVAPSIEKHVSNSKKWNRPAKLVPVASVSKIQLWIPVLIIIVALAFSQKNLRRTGFTLSIKVSVFDVILSECLQKHNAQSSTPIRS